MDRVIYKNINPKLVFKTHWIQSAIVVLVMNRLYISFSTAPLTEIKDALLWVSLEILDLNFDSDKNTCVFLVHFIIKILSLFINWRQWAVATFVVLDEVLQSLDVRYAVLFAVNSQAKRRRSSHTIGQTTRTVKPIYFGSTITKTVMPHFCAQFILFHRKTKWFQ